MTTLEFKLTEQDRVVEFSTTLEGDNIGYYAAAFKSALLAFGFNPNNVNEVFGDGVD